MYSISKASKPFTNRIEGKTGFRAVALQRQAKTFIIISKIGCLSAFLPFLLVSKGYRPRLSLSLIAGARGSALLIE